MTRYDVAALSAVRIAHGIALAEWRQAQGLTQLALAAKVPTSVVNLRKWEQGIALPSDPYRAALAVLGFRPEAA